MAKRCFISPSMQSSTVWPRPAAQRPSRQPTSPPGRSHSSVWAYLRLGSDETLSRAPAGRLSSRPVMGPVFGTWITVGSSPAAASAPAAAQGGAATVPAASCSCASPRKRLYRFSRRAGTSWLYCRTTGASGGGGQVAGGSRSAAAAAAADALPRLGGATSGATPAVQCRRRGLQRSPNPGLSLGAGVDTPYLLHLRAPFVLQRGGRATSMVPAPFTSQKHSGQEVIRVAGSVEMQRRNAALQCRR